MIILRVTNDNGVVTDLTPLEDIDLRLEISAIENTEIGVQFGISSQEFAIAGDNDSNQFFGNLYDLGATPAVALQNSVDCQVLTDGQEVFTGKLYIRNIITDQGDYTIYNVVVVNETIDFKYRIQNLSLRDPKFDWSAYNHTFNAANITGSWTGSLLSGSIVYPHINYGQPEGDNTVPNYAFAGLNSLAALENTIDNADSPLRLIDFKPAIKLKDVIDVIFAGSYTSGSTGYQYTSSFFDSAYFNNLYLLTTSNDQLGPNTVDPTSQNAWAYRGGSLSQTIPYNIATKIDFTAESYDNSNNFDLANDRFTADAQGTYTITAQAKFRVNSYASDPDTEVQLLVRLNGGGFPISLGTRYNPLPQFNTLLGSNTIQLNPGDFVEVFIILRGPSGQTLSLTPGSPLETFVAIQGPPTIIGGTVRMQQQFPDDLKALDLLQGVIEKFNLVIEPVPNAKNLLRIEPYNEWAETGTIIDWTNKVDRDTNFEIQHPAIEQPRTIIFSDEEDDDYLNEYTQTTFDRVYGQYTYTSVSDLAEGERKIGKVFAPTPTTNIPNSNEFIIPHLCTKTVGSDDTYKPMVFKPRLLYGIGPKTVEALAAGFSGSATLTGSYFLLDENGVSTQQTQWYQVSSLTETPISGTAFDVHFNNNNQGAGAIAPYWSNVAPIGSNFISGSGDAFTTYWANYINGLYDVDARKLTCNIYLAPSEVQNIALNQKVFIDGQYYRINKINGANLTRRDSVEVELIKTVARQLTFPRRRIRATPADQPRDVQFTGYDPSGTGRYIDFNTGDFVEDFNIIAQAGPLDGLKVYETGSGTGSAVWNYEPPIIPIVQQTVIGTNNIATDSSKTFTVGSKNSVGKSVSTATTLGQFNTVEENVTNAFVVGQQNTVGQTQQNIQILGGQGNLVSGSYNINNTILSSTGSEMVNSDYSMIINGYNATLRDSDVTTLINPHQDEVVINGSGHTVIGLNLEGAGLDLLNTRNNSNWLGDTYLGEAIFVSSYPLTVGDGTNIALTGSNPGQGLHESLYIVNWSGLSPGTASISLPSATNNDYDNIVYTFKGTNFNVGDQLNIVPFTGSQTIDGATSYALSGDSGSAPWVTLHASGGLWYVINAVGSGGGGGGPATPAFPFTGSAQITGSLGVTGSITSPVIALTASAGTASMDLSTGNAFSITLTTSSATYITATNIVPNQHVALLVHQSASGVSGNGNLFFTGSVFNFPSGAEYITSFATGSKDILTFETFTFNPPVLANSSIQYQLTPATNAPLGATFMSASGGQEFLSGSFRIHKFTGSANLTVHDLGTFDPGAYEYLIVAGGGGGSGGISGTAYGSGGGSGTVETGSTTFATTGSFTATIGAGGAGSGIDANASPGANSSFNGVIAISGSGALTGNGGNNADFNGAPRTGLSGGGGAGGAENGNVDGIGFGGDGVSSTISGSATFFGGGGGGGTNPGLAPGGDGGGGNGSSSAGASGTDGLGGGGGGSGNFNTGGDGGDGVVIIKYQYQA